MQRQGVLGTWLHEHPRLVDAAVVLVLLLLTLPPLWLDFAVADFVPRDPDLLGVTLAVATVLPVVWRCSHPLPAVLAVTVPSVALTLLSYAASTGIPVLVLVYSAAAYQSRTRGLLTLGAGGASFASLLLLTPYRGTWVDTVAVVAMCVAAYAFGRSMGFRRAYVAELELRTQHLEQTRVADTRAALAEERGRIARELHDVVAHHVSVMTVQAAGAQRTLDRSPELTREALVAIETTGRAALREMRRVVGVLRTDDTLVGSELAPLPGLEELDALVSQVREAGLEVEVVVDGTVRDLPQGVDLTAFRLVQEALTNSLKHGGRTRACVRIHHGPRELRVQVVDDGSGCAPELLAPAAAEEGALADHAAAGHGLIGMRERVALYGGDLYTGQRLGGGFEVLARLPLEHVTP